MKKSIILLLVVSLLSLTVFAAYPVKTVEIVCPWGAGGGTDRLARFFADQLQKELGEPFVVVNKTGGGGAVGHSAGAFARPDGYTVTLVTLEISLMHWMGLTTLNVDNFDYVIQLNQDASSVLVKADAPWQTVEELLEEIRKNPGKIKFSGSSAGSIWDLARIGMFNAVGIAPDAVIWVPTTGAAPSIVELLGGHVEVITCSLPEASAQVEAGQLRALAVMANQRLPQYPNVPTLKEQGINWYAGTWRGLSVPKNTPKEVIQTLYNASLKIAQSDTFKDFMNKTGFGIELRGPEEFYEFAKEQDTTWQAILKLGGYAK